MSKQSLSDFMQIIREEVEAVTDHVDELDPEEFEHAKRLCTQAYVQADELESRYISFLRFAMDQKQGGEVLS